MSEGADQMAEMKSDTRHRANNSALSNDPVSFGRQEAPRSDDAPAPNTMQSVRETLNERIAIARASPIISKPDPKKGFKI